MQARPPLVAEALECLGGNGYVEESILPRLYREAPLNGIWEGSGNVICLDVLRAHGRASPEAVDAFFAEVALAGGADARLDAFVDALRGELADFDRHRAPGAPRWSSGWRSRCRARCSCATATRPSPTRSAPRGWRATTAAPSARCRPASTATPSSSAPARVACAVS